MGQHYTRNTVSVSVWCSTCGKETPHKVTDRRLDYCMPCFDNAEQQIKKGQQDKPAKQEGLFK